jgi:hypothetical protein
MKKLFTLKSFFRSIASICILFMFQQQSFAQCATTDVEARTPVIGTHVTGARTVTTTNQTISPEIANKG